jgi:hypothetical protein
MSVPKSLAPCSRHVDIGAPAMGMRQHTTTRPGTVPPESGICPSTRPNDFQEALHNSHAWHIGRRCVSLWAMMGSTSSRV